MTAATHTRQASGAPLGLALLLERGGATLVASRRELAAGVLNGLRGREAEAPLGAPLDGPPREDLALPPLEAMGYVLRGMLMSPGFLYRGSPTPTGAVVPPAFCTANVQDSP